MNRIVYSCIVGALAPLLAVRVRMRARADPCYGMALHERFGRYSNTSGNNARPVWVHAVSLGETRAAQPLVQELLDRNVSVLLTHCTATGRREGMKLFAGAIDRGQLRQAWLPYDFAGACRRFLTTMNPAFGVLIEREIWPNLIHEANERNIPMILANARLSTRSARRGLRAGRVLRDAYAGLDVVLAQSEDDAKRLLMAGTRTAEVCGNLKFDTVISRQQLVRGHAWRAAWDRPVITVASTHEGEEAEFARAIRNLAVPGISLKSQGGGAAKCALLVIVPRHPERFDAVEEQLKALGLGVVRRTQTDPLRPFPAETQVLLGDSMGELATYYAASDVAIVAGGFIAEGGQNLIEACAAGSPVVVGPHARNFQQVTDEAVAAGAAIRVANPQAALDAAFGLLANPSIRDAMVTAGRRYVASRTGAVRRTMRRLEPFLSSYDSGFSSEGHSAAPPGAAVQESHERASAAHPASALGNVSAGSQW